MCFFDKDLKPYWTNPTAEDENEKNWPPYGTERISNSIMRFN